MLTFVVLCGESVISTPSRQIELAARPHGMPTAQDFRLSEVTLPDPGPDQVLVRNLVMSVYSYVRPRMNDVTSYVPAFRLDQPLNGDAVGQVVASTMGRCRPGAWCSTSPPGATAPSWTPRR